MKHFLLFFLFITTTPLIGQKFVQIEKYGSAKVKKYYIGDQLTFRIKAFGKAWLTETIEDIYLADNMILFNNRIVKLQDITAIRSYKRSQWSGPLAKKLYVFGLAWGGFSLLGTLAGVPLTWTAAIVPGTAFATGFLLQKIFKHKTYKLGKRRWLRILNMDQSLGP